MRTYTKLSKEASELLNLWSEINIRNKRQMGKLLNELQNEAKAHNLDLKDLLIETKRQN